VRIGAPENVLKVEVGTVEVDVPRSVGYYGGLAVAVGIGLIEPPLAPFIAAVPVFKLLTNTALPRRDGRPGRGINTLSRVITVSPSQPLSAIMPAPGV
jgi:hypothetical protein